ncbi:hypothetical protein K1T71_004590 [Dendrolimus kikuchii]|uniref:Uncharacterized protein n=1 Tax=Dendrolimus kikuchii TaxID=765133 RepID=A0ACC1D7V0_9NEOP|nr:hypothetical protein K1T71_004590 [Dendrolimus kikuchii]
MMNISPPSRACMMACEIFEVPVEHIVVNVAEGEQHKEEFIKINPNHTIPVLVDGDLVLQDSHAILMYLADMYGKDDVLYPKDTERRSLVNQKLFFDAAVLFPRLLSVAKPAYFDNVKTYTDKQKDDIIEAYGLLEQFLKNTKYLAADHMTIADLSCITFINGLVYIIPPNILKYPRIHSWIENMMKQPLCQRHNVPGAQSYGTDYGTKIIGKMTVKLYKLDLSPPARAAIMACDLFNVPVEMIDVNLFDKEHCTPEFLKKNPMHTVPVLEDGDVTITDSHAILMYLADKYGKNDMYYPKDTDKRALVNQRLFFDSGILFPRLRSVSYAALLEGVKIVSEKQKNDIREAYEFTEEFLKHTKYLAGDHITIADISALTDLSSLMHIVPLDDKYPKIKAWIEDMNSQPYGEKYNVKAAALFGELLKKIIG